MSLPTDIMSMYQRYGSSHNVLKTERREMELQYIKVCRVVQDMMGVPKWKPSVVPGVWPFNAFLSRVDPNDKHWHLLNQYAQELTYARANFMDTSEDMGVLEEEIVEKLEEHLQSKEKQKERRERRGRAQRRDRSRSPTPHPIGEKEKEKEEQKERAAKNFHDAIVNSFQDSRMFRTNALSDYNPEQSVKWEQMKRDEVENHQHGYSGLYMVKIPEIELDGPLTPPPSIPPLNQSQETIVYSTPDEPDLYGTPSEEEIAATQVVASVMQTMR
jgi:hypothetical protein